MAKNERITIFLDEKEKKYLDDLRLRKQISFRELFFISIQRAFPDEKQLLDDKFNLDEIEGKAKMQHVRKYYSHAILHQEVFLKAMELTKMKINPQEILDKVVNPGIESVTAYKIKDGVHALKQLKRWMETDFRSFEEYSEEFWQDKKRIYDMIRRLEVNSFAKAVKYLDHLEKEDENIEQVRKNMEVE